MIEKKTITLKGQDIILILDDISDSMKKAEYETEEILKASFMFEDALINCQKNFGEETSIKYIRTERFGKNTFSVKIDGAEYNPFEVVDQFSSTLIRNLTAEMALVPIWKYEKNSNVISFSFSKTKPLPSFVKISMPIVLGIGSGLLCNLIPSVAEIINNYILQPFVNTFVGAIGAISGPIVFLSVLWGILSMGDTATLSKIGKTMIARFMGVGIIISALSCAPMLPFYTIEKSSSGSFAFSQIYSMLLDIVPTNVVKAFADGNSMQIVFIAIMVGIAALLINEKTGIVAGFVEQSTYVVQIVMSIINKILPLFIFSSMFNLVVSGAFSNIASIYKFFITYFISVVVTLSLYTVYVCITQKISPVLLWKKIAEPVIIAFTTASSSAALTKNMEICKNKLGVDSKIVNVAVPLGQILFMVGACVEFFATSLYAAELYGTQFNVMWIITSFILIFILSVAAPPVSGATVACYTVILAQLGIPAEALAICCSIGFFTDFVSTAVNIATLEMEIIQLSSKLGMIDKDILRNEK